MRRILLAIGLAPMLTFAQGGVWDTVAKNLEDAADVASGKSVFQVAKPDIIIQVSKHRFGADMFEVAAVNPAYPPELLKSQLAALCDSIGVPARGLVAGKASIGGDPNRSATKASFATDGIIDREHGILRIEPIIKAFAAAPAPFTVHGLMISFNGESSGPSILKSFSSPGLRVQAIADQNPPAIEYRVQLLSQDRSQLNLPEPPPAPTPEQRGVADTSTDRREGVSWILWLALILGAAAAAVLVYFITMRATAKPGG